MNDFDLKDIRAYRQNMEKRRNKETSRGFSGDEVRLSFGKKEPTGLFFDAKNETEGHADRNFADGPAKDSPLVLFAQPEQEEQRIAEPIAFDGVCEQPDRLTMHADTAQEAEIAPPVARPDGDLPVASDLTDKTAPSTTALDGERLAEADDAAHPADAADIVLPISADADDPETEADDPTASRPEEEPALPQKAEPGTANNPADETEAVSVTSDPLPASTALIVVERPRGKQADLILPHVIYLGGEVKKKGDALKHLLRRVFLSRAAAFSLLSLLLLLPLYVFANYGDFYYLTHPEQGTQTVHWVIDGTARGAAESVLPLRDADQVVVEAFGTTGLLSVRRSFPVNLQVDGNTKTVWLLDKTAGDLLREEGVTLSDDDLLSHAPMAELRSGDSLIVQRVRKIYREVVEEIPFPVVKKNSPMLRADREFLVQYGKNGLAERVYFETYVDGELVSSEIAEETVLRDSLNEVILTGDPQVPASSLNGEDFTNIRIVNGVPETYQSVMENAICTAYSFGPGTFGASGMRLIQGFVATNPAVIPYGTLLYIASDRFTYGWAIAADCGTAMMEGYVDIDCFFETYDESAMFGKKALNVYIIGQLTQSELEEYIANGMFYSRVPTVADPIP